MNMRLGGLVHALIHSFEPGLWGYTESWGKWSGASKGFRGPLSALDSTDLIVKLCNKIAQ